jgi:hypothetical protein
MKSTKDKKSKPKTLNKGLTTQVAKASNKSGLLQVPQKFNAIEMSPQIVNANACRPDDLIK